MKQKLVLVATIALFYSFNCMPVFAGSLSGLDDFSPTKKVYPADMNSKMQDISTAVNDNNQKIDDHIANAPAQAQAAMGDKADTNPLNHDRYTDAEAQAALSSHTTNNPYAHHYPPQMWASIDQGASEETSSGVSAIEINKVDIEVLTDGFLVISGSTIVHNTETTTNWYFLSPFIGLDYALPSSTDFSGFAAATEYMPADGSTTLNYTVTVFVSAGAYSVSQKIETGSSTKVGWNGNHLTVTFYSQQQGTIVNPIP